MAVGVETRGGDGTPAGHTLEGLDAIKNAAIEPLHGRKAGDEGFRADDCELGRSIGVTRAFDRVVEGARSQHRLVQDAHHGWYAAINKQVAVAREDCPMRAIIELGSYVVF